MLTWKVCKLQSGEVGATNVHRSVNIELIIILNDSVYIYEMKFLLILLRTEAATGRLVRNTENLSNFEFLVDDANHGKYNKHIS